MKIPEEYIDDPGLKEIAAKITAGGRISAWKRVCCFTRRAEFSLLAILVGNCKKKEESRTMSSSTEISILNQQTNVFITAVSAHTINLKEILKAGNTLMMRCLT